MSIDLHVDRERVRKVAMQFDRRGYLTTEDCMQLAEAGVHIYSLVDREAVKAGDVKELPAEVLALAEV